jgi:membrane protein
MPKVLQPILLRVRELGSVLKQAGIAWVEDDATMHAASISYFTVFSLAPILVIALAVAGVVFEPETVQREMAAQLSGLMGAEAARAIGEFVQNATSAASHGVLATIVGVVTLVVGAISAFVQLQDSLNHIWRVPPRSAGLKRILKQRLLSFVLVIGVALLLLVSLVLSTLLSATSNLIQSNLGATEFTLDLANVAFSFVVAAVLFGTIFKVLPDAAIGWNDVAAASLFTSALFTIGKQLIGLYIGQTGLSSSYGAAGSLEVILAWVYYSALILLFGAEFAWVVRLRGQAAKV